MKLNDMVIFGSPGSFHVVSSSSVVPNMINTLFIRSGYAKLFGQAASPQRGCLALFGVNITAFD